MDHHKLVLPEHMNHYGFLFGGYLLQWIDEFAYITVTAEHPGQRFVTVAMSDVQFRSRIRVGEVLRFTVERERVGTSSVTYRVRTRGLVVEADPDRVLFETTMTFVRVDAEGHKAPLSPGG